MKSLLKLFLILFFGGSAWAQTSNLSGIINSYTRVNNIFTQNCSDSISVLGTSGFAIGDSVLIIQMEGATIDSTNTSSFGNILSYGNSGNFELLKILSINGNTIHFTTSIKNNYSVSGSVQLVTIPHYVNAVIIGTLTAQAWNGVTGGILSFSVGGTLTLNADVIVSGFGFRGGSASPNYYTGWYYDFCFGSVPGRGGKKGEGIVPYFTNKEYGRGAQANGGGAGNDINTAGAGGGNYGAGGHGGNNYFSPDTLWGLSGKSLAAAINLNKIYLGGGGGGGHQNNSAGSAGTNGGGIIFIRANTIIGNNHFIRTNGLDNIIVAGIDGAGGGGAGGSILIDVATFTGNLTLEAKGGKGGDQNYPPQCHGNGGGGGGGLIIFSGSTFPVNVITSVAGGVKGVGQCNNTPDDAANGSIGGIVYNWSIPLTIVVANAGPDKTICEGDSVQIGIAPVSGLAYNWNNGAGAIANPYVSPILTTTYILTVTDSFCNIDYDTIIVFVNPKPVASFTDSIGCSLTVSFTNTSTGFQTSQWNFGDGNTSTLNNPVHTYASAGTYSVTLIVTSTAGCKDTIIQQINIVSTGNVSSQFVFQSQNCSGTVTFTNQSLNATSYVWNFGDGTPLDNNSNPSHIYLSSGIYTVILIAINACNSDTIQQQVTINIQPAVSAAFIINTQPCSFTVSITNQTLNATSYSWNFGDGTPPGTNANPSHTYSAPGVYIITLIATNSCNSDTLQQQVTINVPQPVAAAFNFTMQPCSYTVNFTNQSANAVSYSWNFGDGSPVNTTTNPSHTYPANGIYTVTLIASNACGSDTIQQQFTIYVPLPVTAAFTINSQPCSLTISLTNQSTPLSIYVWDFGDGNTSQQVNPVHTYSLPGIYTITLAVNNGCFFDTLQHQIDLTGAVQPVANFTFTTQPCDLTVTLINQSQNTDSVLWNFGDATIDTIFNPVHTYPATGIYTVTLISFNQCGADTLIQTVVDTFSQGVALFSFDQQPCEAEIQFISQSQNAFSFLWDFGDGKNDTSQNPIHAYLVNGSYTVTLIVNAGTLCADTLEQTVNQSYSDTSLLFIPNVFTPNDDGSNEFFEISGNTNCDVYYLKIFNRWGQLIYETSDLNKHWDGTFKGKNVPQGVYYYLLEGTIISRHGTVTVLR